MRFGAHVSTRGHLPKAIDAALGCGAETFQIWVSNPRAWAAPVITPEAAREFAERREESGLGPVFAHASYLVNLASPNPRFRRSSVDLARRELEAVAAIGADGLVVHTGAGGIGDREAALARAAASIEAILGEHPRTDLILELTAGGQGAVASTLEQARELLDAAGRHPRLGLCIDTCHLFAAGEPLDSLDGVARTLGKLRGLGLTRRLRLIQANDSKDPRGSRRDRHEHIGKGFIGDDGFRAILAHPALREVPVIVETPGRVDDHARNIRKLRELAGSTRAGSSRKPPSRPRTSIP